ncbi:MAG TPA: ABC transporter permease [Actinomycetota bacterium]|nr:ABC transporter permease [Actinomycetota bacterium]
MAVSGPRQAGVAVPGETGGGPDAPVTFAPEAPTVPRRRSELLYFAFRNWKFGLGLGVVLACLALALVGPLLTEHAPLDFTGPTDQRPSSEYWFGTTSYGQDVYSQFVYGLRAAFLVGALGGGIAWLIGATVGFTAGYRGGWIDDILNMLTNVVLVIPTLAILIIVAAYLEVQSYTSEAIIIGLTSWPWAARAVRSQTFSLKTREYVEVARLSGRSTRQVIASELAPNMSSYLLMMFILLFGGAILIGASLDFLGLGPTESVSLGLMMYNSFSASALLLGSWWWFLPPGLGIIAIVGGLYVMNVGLDEVFNPKLRET